MLINKLFLFFYFSLLFLMLLLMLLLLSLLLLLLLFSFSVRVVLVDSFYHNIWYSIYMFSSGHTLTPLKYHTKAVHFKYAFISAQFCFFHFLYRNEHYMGVLLIFFLSTFLNSISSSSYDCIKGS